MRAVFLLSALWGAALVSANFQYTSPIAGQVCVGGVVCTVSWFDDGTEPSVASYGEVDVALYAGASSTSAALIQNFQRANPNNLQEITPTIDATVGPDGAFYFVRITSVQGDNTQTIDSAMFTLAQMTGTLSAEAAAAVAGTAAASSSTTSAAVAASTAASTESSSDGSSISSTTTAQSAENTKPSDNVFGSGSARSASISVAALVAVCALFVV